MAAIRLTETLIDRICQSIRAGAYAHVAAEMAGVPAAMFADWLRRGNGPRSRGLYRRLASEVRQARAHARFMAESRVRIDAPLKWLLHGPGRETAERAGWSAPTRSPSRQDRFDCFEQLQRIVQAVSNAAGDDPTVRQFLARLLANCDEPPDDNQHHERYE